MVQSVRRSGLRRTSEMERCRLSGQSVMGNRCSSRLMMTEFGDMGCAQNDTEVSCVENFRNDERGRYEDEAVS